MSDEFDNFVTPIPSSSGSTGDDDFESSLTPLHQFDQTAISNSTADRDELAKMWLSGGNNQPNTVSEFQAIKEKAKAAGLTTDDVIQAAEEKQSGFTAAASKIYRNGGPIYRGVTNGVDSVRTSITNLAYRGLSYIPGWESLATKADENNRYRDVTNAVRDTLDREGSLAQIITPTGASLIGDAATGLGEVGTIALLPGLGEAAAAEGATAEGATALAKVAQMSASKKLALYYGLKTSEEALTAGTDAGLSPNMRLANAAVIGSINASFTFGFGQMATELGLSTPEQAILGAKPAVAALVERTGLQQAAASMAISAGEQAAMQAAQIGWGSVIGTDNSTAEDRWNSVIKSAAVGAVMRGSTEVLPAFKDFHEKYIKTQEAMPETVKGTLDAQKASEASPETPAPPPETASENYKAAYQAELDHLSEMHAESSKSLESINLDEQSLKSRMDKFLAAKRGMAAIQDSTDSTIPDPIKEQLRKMGFSEDAITEGKVVGKPETASAEDAAAQAKLATEGEAIKAERDKLVERRKAAEADLKAAEDLLKGLSDPVKENIKAKVVADVETAKTAANIENHKVVLTRAQNDLNAKFREQYGLSELPETEQVATEQSLANARAKGLVQRADEIAAGIVHNGKAMSSDEQQGMREAAIHRADTIEKYQQIKDDPNASELDRNDAAVKVTDAMKSADLLTQALKAGRADTGRVLAQGQKDLTNAANVREYGRQSKGSDLTDDEAAGLTADAVNVTNIESRARRIKEELGKPESKPLTLEGFTFRETLRAETAKGSPLTRDEESAVVAQAKKLFNTVGDANKLDAEQQQKLNEQLYVQGVKARTELEFKIKQLEPKTLGGVASLANGIWRAFLTSGDLFPLFRQGVTHPIVSLTEGVPAYFRALFSEDGAILAQKEINEAKYAGIGREAGLAIIGSDTPFASGESGMVDAAHEALPYLGNFARAYRVGMNAVRSKVFENHIDSVGGLSHWDSSNLQGLARFVNNATGRGTLLGFEQSASALSKFMIAPRNFTSRLTYLTPFPLMKEAYAGNRTAAQVMLKTYAKQVAGLAVMTAFAEQAGKAAFGDDQVEFYRNPADFNFGRLRIGQTMIDITGGLGRPYRYATSIFEPLIAKTEDRKSLKSTGDAILGIARGQLAPLPSSLVSAGEVYLGRKDAGAEAMNYILPWSFNDSIKALTNEGMDKGGAIAALNLFGAGSYTTERNK